MGQEIGSCNFNEKDYIEFKKRLGTETILLGEMLASGEFDNSSKVAGFELESWLIDSKGAPAPKNLEFLKKVSDPDVVAELALFNVELNGALQVLTLTALSQMHTDLGQRWDKCQAVADDMNLDIVSVGILPTVKNPSLCIANMSKLKRYQALNQEILKLRHGKPIALDIKGKQSLKLVHNDVMLEAAATSFQLHMQVAADKAWHYYNIAKIVSAATVAIGANSPFLFGKELWAETRIPLFEQSVSVGGSCYSSRVNFGMSFAKESIFEVFAANNERYPVLLPILFDSEEGEFAHLMLHNGTLWRWNRPLLGFDQNGVPHVRIEHRVIASAPSLIDQMANAAFFFGLMGAFESEDLEQKILFSEAKRNFYNAAKYGLSAEVTWFDDKKINLRKLCLETLLPLSSQGLEKYNIATEDINLYLGVIEQRLATGQTGAAWQVAWVKRYGIDWKNLVLQYIKNQKTGCPVHTWKV